MFADREEAGRKLGAKLMRFKGQDACVFALPRGGVPVGFEIARMLGAPLDLIIVRKLGAPHQPELAIGALADGEHPQIVLNDDIVTMLRVSGEYIAEEKERQLLEIERRRQSYLAGRPRASASRRIAIIVDDGIATGATIRAAIRSIRAAKPARLVLAVPVAPTETIAALRREADEIVCLEAHEDFMAISIYYRNFRQLDDEEVRDLLARIPSPPPAATPEQRA
mgnify:CR=1 FL=1